MLNYLNISRFFRDISTDRRLCHHWIAAGLLQLSVLRHVKQQFSKVTESAECCRKNCLPSSTTWRQHHSADLLKDLHWLPVRGRVDLQDCRPLL